MCVVAAVNAPCQLTAFEIWLAALQDLQGMPPEDGDGEAHVLEVVLAVRGVAVPIRDLDTALQHIGGSQRKASK